MKVATSSSSAQRTLHLQATVPADVDTAAHLLRDGRVVAIPTETVYGLAANALNQTAVESIFVAKARPKWDPLIVHVSDMGMLLHVVREVPTAALKLMESFWPGPLTLLLPRHAGISDSVTAGRDLVGVRMPSHPVALELIRTSGVPLAAPSANLFGHISPTTVAHVLTDLDGRIDAVLDAGPCEIGVESTVLDPVARVLYRQGGVSKEQIEGVLGKPVTVYYRREDVTKPAAKPESLPSPGVGMRHYAPKANLMLVHSEKDLDELLHHVTPEHTGVMLPKGWKANGWTGNVFAWERWNDPAALARTLYTGLRTLDQKGVRTIVCPLPASSAEPLVEAIRDRLLKAARDS
ncbi:MAG: L-threonylcarbamoyladenylate synthase [Terriglobus sp.]